MLGNLTKLALCTIPRKIMMIFLSKGSAYPDINGGIGILFEQASSRGYNQYTENGLLTFPSQLEIN